MRTHHPITTRLRRGLAAAVAVAVTAFLPAATPARAADGRPAAKGGYWMVASDGGVFSFGSARFFGSTGHLTLNQPIVGIAATPTGNGYWMVATDGGIFSFGDARFFGSTGALTLNKPIVGMAATPSGNGYWFVASDGGVFAFGDAAFYGSTGGMSLAKPITAVAATPSGRGYWFAASDGGVFSYGDARFFGAAPQRPAVGQRMVAAMVPSPDGAGYWQASAAGELLAFGGAPDLGGLTRAPNRPIVGLAAVSVPAVGISAGTGDDSGAGTPTGGGAGTTATTGGSATTTSTTSAPTTTTTSVTTTTTVPPASGPSRFSSTAKVSWGTPSDLDRPSVNSAGETVYPYAQKVSSIVEIGDRVYIGGRFTDLTQTDRLRTTSGVPLAYLAELDTDGIPVPGSLFNATVRLDGPVRALHRSADGRRLYVGGEFSRVNGEVRRRLVALDPATGQIDRSFSPLEPSSHVSAIAEHGSRLYIAGTFSRLGPADQHQLAALDAGTGTLDTGFVPPARYPGRFEGNTGKRVDAPTTSGDPTGVITSLLLAPDGRHLMVGGSFLHFGFDHDADPDHRHGGLIAVDPATGALTPWQPDQGSNGSRPVFGMTAYPGDPRAIGVDAPVMIYTASGGAGGRVLAWAPGGKTTRLWRGSMDGDAMAVAATRDRVYVVGHFDHTVPDPNDPCLDVRDLGNGHFGVSCPDGTPSRHLAGFYAAGEIVNGKNTGKSRIDTDFTAQADTSEGPYAVVVGADNMYVGGNFFRIAASPTDFGGERVKQPGFAVYPAL